MYTLYGLLAQLQHNDLAAAEANHAAYKSAHENTLARNYDRNWMTQNGLANAMTPRGTSFVYPDESTGEDGEAQGSVGQDTEIPMPVITEAY